MSIPIDLRRVLRNAPQKGAGYSKPKKYRQETLMSKVESERMVTFWTPDSKADARSRRLRQPLAGWDVGIALK
jgi:hypothetical protein